MSVRFAIRHKTGWTACLTWSRGRAESWLADFDAQKYTDKTLHVEDFEIVDRFPALAIADVDTVALEIQDHD